MSNPAVCSRVKGLHGNYQKTQVILWMDHRPEFLADVPLWNRDIFLRIWDVFQPDSKGIQVEQRYTFQERRLEACGLEG